MNKNVTVKEYIRLKALGLLGMIDSNVDPRARSERLTFVNDINDILKEKIKEYNVWYAGDADEILNFYTRNNVIDYNTDPLFNRNKKSYFWSVSSTESDIKRTHSGQPRNIVDTLVNIVGMPNIGVGVSGVSVLEKADLRLKEILEENFFARVLLQKARPLTFVEGWGAWRIDWDTNFSDVPLLVYYRADSVDFVVKSNKLIAIIYQDYFQDKKGRNYLLFETRRTERRNGVPCLIIEKDLFRINGDSEVLTPVELCDLPQLKDVEKTIIIENYSGFLGCQSVIFQDNYDDLPGRSIFTGKTDLFDDLDQCMSQAANTVRRSTVHEYFNTLYLEKDQFTGMPIMPHDFDRKYIAYKGMMGGDGASGGGQPVQVTQPSLDFNSYSAEETNILLNIISGIMSPATLGIDIAKKDNAEAQREKEKVTIFTRNIVMNEEGRMLRVLMNDLLIADELMHTGTVSCLKYDIYVIYDEFADTSFESKLETVLTAWQAGVMSDDLITEYLYGNKGKGLKERELKFLKHQREMQEQMMVPPDEDPELQGEFGELGADNEYNFEHEV